MSDTIAPTLLDASGLPVSARILDALALVWAEDEQLAAAAEDVLAHALWPYYFLFRVVEVRRVPLGAPCPLPEESPHLLAGMWRERWVWVLVAPGTTLEAVAPCT